MECRLKKGGIGSIWTNSAKPIWFGHFFLESVYQKAMVIELGKADLKSEEEKSLQVYYDHKVVGNFSIDLYVEDTVVVELKSVQSLLIEHEIQLVNYLKGVKRDIGLFHDQSHYPAE